MELNKVIATDINRPYEKIGEVIKDISDELPFEIPDSWEWVRLKNYSLIIFSGKSPKYSKEITPHKVIGQQANQWYGVDMQFCKYCTEEFALNMPKEYYLQNGDVLLNTLGNGTLGRSGIFFNNLSNTPVLTDGHLFVFRNLTLELSYYLLIYLKIKYEDIVRSANGSTNQTFLNLGNTLEWLIPVPPQEEIKRIVAEIEKYEPLLAEYDRLEQQATKLDDEIYDKLKKSILQYAIQGKLVPQDLADEPASVLLDRIRAEKKAKLGKKYVESYIYKGDDNCYYEKIGKNEPVLLENLPFEIPDNWCWARLGEIGDWGAGATPQRSNPEFYNNGTIPWLKTGELNDSYIYDSEEKITEIALKKCSLRYNQVGDVLIVMYGATIGKLGIVGKPLTTNQACCACTPNIYNEFLFYLLMANKDNFIKMGFGGAQPNISREKIINFLVPVPPYLEQYHIVNKLKELFNFIDKGEN